MTATKQEQLEEAAEFYQSIVSTFPDEVFPRMAGYFKKHFHVIDPAVIRQGIKQIREYLGLLNPWEREVIRLEEDLMRRCREHNDIPIYVSVEEWNEALLADEIQYCLEEYKVRFDIGVKVRRILLINEIPNSGMLRYGIVRANETAYIVNRDPFDEQHMHDFKKCRPKQESFATAEEYAAAVREYDQKEIARQAQIVAIAGMLSVEWFDCNGNSICWSWEPANKIQEYTEAGAEVAVTT